MRSPLLSVSVERARQTLLLVQKQGTLLAMLQCSLSLWERVRVRGFSHNPGDPHPPPSPEGRGSYGPCPKRLPESALATRHGGWRCSPVPFDVRVLTLRGQPGIKHRLLDHLAGDV